MATGNAAGAPRKRQLIEEHSYDYVPLAERHGDPRSLFFVWFGASAHVLTAVTGTLAIGLGLNFWWALVAILLGNLMGALFMAFHSAQGPRLGLPQVIQSRGQFGYQGALLILLVVWAMYIGYTAFDILLSGQGFQGVIGGNLNLWLILMAALLAVLAIFGYDWIHRFMAYQTWFYVAVFVVVTIALIAHGVPVAALNHGGFDPGHFLLAVSYFAVWQISYAPYVSDYSRYLSPNTASRTFWGTYLGTCTVSIALMVLGAAIAALAPAVATLDEIKALGGSVLGPILVLILAFGLIPPSAMNIYGGALATLTIANNVRRFTSTAALRVLACLFVAVVSLGVATVGSGNFMTSFENYLSALLYFLIPWTAINLTDFYLIRGGVYRTEDFFEPNGAFGRFNWRGLLVYFVTFAIEIPFMNTTVFQGPLSKALGGADLAWLVGLAISIPFYYLLARRPGQPAPRLEELTSQLEPTGTSKG